MRAGDPIGDGEAQPGAAARAGWRFAPACLVHAVESLEDMRQVFGGDAYTRIAHAHADHAVLLVQR